MSVLQNIYHLEADGYDPRTILAIIVHRLEADEADRDADTSAEADRMDRLTRELVSDPFAGVAS